MAEELNIAEITVEEFFNAVGDGTFKSKASKAQAKNILEVLNKEKYNFDTKMSMEEFNKNKTIHILLDIFKEEQEIPIITEEIAKKLRGDKKENWKDIVGERYIPTPTEMQKATGGIGTAKAPIAPKHLKDKYDRIRELIDTYNAARHTADLPKYANAIQYFERTADATKGSWGATGYDHPQRNILYPEVKSKFILSAHDRVITELPSNTFEERSTKNYVKLKENTGIRHSGTSAELSNITFGKDITNPAQGAYYDSTTGTFFDVGAKTNVKRPVPANDSAMIAVKEQIANRERQLGRKLGIGEKLFDTKTVPVSVMDERINKKLTEVMNNLQYLDENGNLQTGYEVKEWDREKFKWKNKTKFTLKEYRGGISTALSKIKEIAPDEKQRKKIADFVLAHSDDPEDKTPVLDRSYLQNTIFDTDTTDDTSDHIRRAMYFFDKHKSENILAYDSTGKLILDEDGNPQRKYINLDTGEPDYIKMLSAQSTYDQTDNPDFNISREYDNKQSTIFRIFKNVSSIDTPVQHSVDDGALIHKEQKKNITSPFQPDVKQLEFDNFARRHFLNVIKELQLEVSPEDGSLMYPQLLEWNRLDNNQKETYLEHFQKAFGKNDETLQMFQQSIEEGTKRSYLIGNQIPNVHSAFVNGLALVGYKDAKKFRQKVLKEHGIGFSSVAELSVEPSEKEDKIKYTEPNNRTLHENMHEAKKVLRNSGMSSKEIYNSRKDGSIFRLASEKDSNFAQRISQYNPETVTKFLSNFSKTAGAIAVAGGIGKTLLKGALYVAAPQTRAGELIFELGLQASTPSTPGKKPPESFAGKIQEMFKMTEGRSEFTLEGSQYAPEIIGDVKSQIDLEERQRDFLDKKLKLRGDLGKQVGLMFESYHKKPSLVEGLNKEDFQQMQEEIAKAKPKTPSPKVTAKELDTQMLQNQMDVNTGRLSKKDFIDTFPSNEGIVGQKGVPTNNPRSASYWIRNLEKPKDQRGPFGY